MSTLATLVTGETVELEREFPSPAAVLMRVQILGETGISEQAIWLGTAAGGNVRFTAIIRLEEGL